MLPRIHHFRRLARISAQSPIRPPRSPALRTIARAVSYKCLAIPLRRSLQDRSPSQGRLFHASARSLADEPFKLADIGEGITEVEIVSWSVKEGDVVEEFDMLCEVQSDKSTVELTAPFSGKIHHIAFNDGETVKVGQVLCRITTEGDEGAEAQSQPTAEAETVQTKQGSGETAGADTQELDIPEVQQAVAEPLEPVAEETQEQSDTTAPYIGGEPVQDLSYEAAPLLETAYAPEPAPSPAAPPAPERKKKQTTDRDTERRSVRGDGYIPPPPPRQIVRPVQDPHDKMSSMDRALIGSLRAAADAGEASQAAYETAELLAEQDPAIHSAGPSEFSGEAAVVRGHEPRRVEVSREPVPDRRAAEGERDKEIIKASPAVRTMAARLGVKLEDVRPTGDGGRVTQQDVQNAVMAQHKRSEASTQPGPSSPSPTQPASSAGPSRPPVPAPSALPYPSDRKQIPEIAKVEFGRTRKVMYRAMGDMARVPHFGYSHTLNLTPLLPYLRALNAPPIPAGQNYLASDIPREQARDPVGSTPRQKTTLLSFLVKGLLLAMEEHPIMRSRAREQGSNRFLDISRDGVIGVAVSDPKYGLVTPSLSQLPPSTSLTQLTSALSALRQNPTKPSSPAHITISSVGGLGEGRDMMPVLPPGGGVAICAVGRARWEVEWKKGSGKGIMDMMPEEVEKGGTEAVLRVPVGWSGDHRILEGAELIAFTETWRKYIEEPWRWISID